MNALILVGSLRGDSYNALLARELVGLMPEGVSATIFDGLAELPHYNEELDSDAVPGLGAYDRPGTPGFCIAIHAEVNALLFATRDTKGATAYITDPPCPGCRKALAAAGIIRVVWPDGTHDAEALVDWGG